MDGYMLLAERLRDEDEKAIVQSTLKHIREASSCILPLLDSALMM